MDATTTEAVDLLRRLRAHVEGPKGEEDDPALIDVVSWDAWDYAGRPDFRAACRALGECGYYRLAYGGHRPERLAAIDRAIATLEAQP